jgi:hypothetical protein
MARFSKGPWRVVTRTTRGRRHLTEIRDGNNDVVALVYTNGDSRVLVRALRLYGCLKHLAAIVRMRKDLRESERAKLDVAEKLIAEVQA